MTQEGLEKLAYLVVKDSKVCKVVLVALELQEEQEKEVHRAHKVPVANLVLGEHLVLLEQKEPKAQVAPLDLLVKLVKLVWPVTMEI